MLPLLHRRSLPSNMVRHHEMDDLQQVCRRLLAYPTNSLTHLLYAACASQAASDGAQAPEAECGDTDAVVSSAADPYVPETECKLAAAPGLAEQPGRRASMLPPTPHTASCEGRVVASLRASLHVFHDVPAPFGRRCRAPRLRLRGQPAGERLRRSWGVVHVTWITSKRNWLRGRPGGPRWGGVRAGRV